jgi:hypothetical protein
MDTAMSWQEDSWLTLAEPAHGHANNPRYLQLLAALDEGWLIVPPVYRRPRWLDDREQVYHFILRHSDRPGTRLITVPEDEVVRTFIHDQKLTLY